MVSAIALPLLMNMITFDRPRVVAIATIPVVEMCAVCFAAMVKDNPDKPTRVTLEAIVWLGTPLVFWGRFCSIATLTYYRPRPEEIAHGGEGG